MRRLAIATCISALLAAGTPAAEELPPLANGSLKLGAAEFKLVDGIAFADGDVTWIALSSSAFDRKSMKEDERLDTFDVMRHPGQALLIDLGAEGPLTCLGLSLHDESGQTSDSVCNEEFATAVGVQRTEDGRVAGASSWKGENGDHVTFMFNLPIEE